jgi:NAD(P)-dependent dehydrogenase (short-subunit alcohol dehydrogenase family)
MQFTMHGRRALITGGSLGIGLAIGETFARAGASVAVVARRVDVLEAAKARISAAGAPKAVAISADVGQAAECERAFKEAVAGLGGVDVLVNNAGTSQRGTFESITDELWQHDLDLKLFAAIRLARLALPGMKAAKFGRIINILNTGAKAPPAEGAPTAVTRAAGMALTKVLANEGARHNVLVNGLLVGRIESDQWVRRHSAEGQNQSLEDYYAQMGKSLPMGRLGTAQEFANAALFLASDAGSYINGTAINVDGGLCPVV